MSSKKYCTCKGFDIPILCEGLELMCSEMNFPYCFIPQLNKIWTRSCFIVWIWVLTRALLQRKQSQTLCAICYAIFAVFFECLTNTMRFVHEKLVKHMDIKPSNILVKAVKGDCLTYRIYLADFGISRSYEKPEDVDTDSITNCTRAYAAPEVVRQESRGLSADIFSLGCVFLEMLSILSEPMQRSALLEVRKANPDSDRSYQANIEAILASESFRDLSFVDESCYGWLEETKKMVCGDAQHRPTAEALREVFGYGQGCCYQGSVPFEAAENSTQPLTANTGTDDVEKELKILSLCLCGRGEIRAYERCTISPAA